jgi:hypothetical protein
MHPSASSPRLGGRDPSDSRPIAAIDGAHWPNVCPLRVWTMKMVCRAVACAASSDERQDCDSFPGRSPFMGVYSPHSYQKQHAPTAARLPQRRLSLCAGQHRDRDQIAVEGIIGRTAPQVGGLTPEWPALAA